MKYFETDKVWCQLVSLTSKTVASGCQIKIWQIILSPRSSFLIYRHAPMVNSCYFDDLRIGFRFRLPLIIRQPILQEAHKQLQWLWINVCRFWPRCSRRVHQASAKIVHLVPELLIVRFLQSEFHHLMAVKVWYLENYFCNIASRQWVKVAPGCCKLRWTYSKGGKPLYFIFPWALLYVTECVNGV